VTSTRPRGAPTSPRHRLASSADPLDQPGASPSYRRGRRIAGFAVGVGVAAITARAVAITRHNGANADAERPDAAPARSSRRIPALRSRPRVVAARMGESGQSGAGPQTAAGAVAAQDPALPRHRSPHPTHPSVAVVGAPTTRRRLAAATVTIAALGTAVFVLTHGPDGHSGSLDSAQASDSVARPSDFPPAAPDPGVYVTATLRPDGSLATDQWVTAGEPIDSLDLATASGDHLDFQPAVSELSVVADGDHVPAATTSDELSGHTTIALAQKVRYMHLSYVVSGVTLLTDSAVSPPGRALVLLNSAHVRSPTEGAQVIHVNGGDVLSLSCWSEDVAPAPCGAKTKTGWAVRLPASDASVSVVAQVDLPDPRSTG
jgi:hypothetical protein